MLKYQYLTYVFLNFKEAFLFQAQIIVCVKENRFGSTFLPAKRESDVRFCLQSY